MRYRVDFYMISPTEPTAQSIADRFSQDLSVRNDFQYAHGPAVYLDGDSHGMWMATGGGWFNSESGARDLRTILVQRMTAGPLAPTILAGSVVELHPCNNEDRSACLRWTIEFLTKQTDGTVISHKEPEPAPPPPTPEPGGAI